MISQRLRRGLVGLPEAGDRNIGSVVSSMTIASSGQVHAGRFYSNKVPPQGRSSTLSSKQHAAMKFRETSERCPVAPRWN